MPNPITKMLTPFFLGAAALACSLSNPGSPPASSSPDAANTTLLQDDFSDAASGWNVKTIDGILLEYTDDEFRIFVDNDSYSYVYQIAYLDQSLTDVRVEVEAQRISGSANASFYVICRRVDGDNFIYGDVDFEGDANLGMVADSQQEILVNAADVDVLQEGINRLRLDCIGDSATFYVNDVLVSTMEVNGPSTGAIGFGAGGAGEGQTDYRFDNLVVYSP